MIEIYGMDTEGIEGVLIRFSAVLEASARGMAILGLARKVVAEGCERAIKAIKTVDGNWNMSNFRITMQLSPSETPKHSAGLDLPIAITLLTASLLMDEENINECIEELHKEAGKKNAKNNPKMLLRQIAQFSDHRSNIKRYRKRITEDTNKYCLIGTLDIASGNICLLYTSPSPRDS